MTEREKVLLDVVKNLTFALETIHNLGAPLLPPKAVEEVRRYVVYGKDAYEKLSHDT